MIKHSGSYLVAVAREEVFRAITDPLVLERCIEGCEKLVLTAEHSYDVHMKIGLAGLKGSYVGQVRLEELVVPESYTLVMEGKGKPGFVKGKARILLREEDGRTELLCEAETQVGGMIAAVGSRLVGAAGRKMMESFFSRFAALMERADLPKGRELGP